MFQIPYYMDVVYTPGFIYRSVLPKLARPRKKNCTFVLRKGPEAFLLNSLSLFTPRTELCHFELQTKQGHPTTVFLLNTLKTLFAIQSTFRYLEMHSKRRYKICICSVILGEFQTFRKGGEIWRITKVRHFLVSLSIAFLNPKILGSLFSTKNSLT